jgi:DNA-binding PadR family transcriptional regulator
MFIHLVLGFLRDGRAHHGYELATEYRRATAVDVSTGNIYRALQRLSTKGLVQTEPNPPEADGRRIPYTITARGSRLFDDWLVAPCASGVELCERLIFVDRLARPALAGLIDRWEEDLSSGRDGLSGDESAPPSGEADPAARVPLQLRRSMIVAAELDFIREIRRTMALDVYAHAPGRDAPRRSPAGTGVAASVRAGLSGGHPPSRHDARPPAAAPEPARTPGRGRPAPVLQPSLSGGRSARLAPGVPAPLPGC